MHEADLRESTQLGCPICYEAFPQLIGAITWEHHGSAVHHGRLPYAPEVRIQVRREAYLQALDRAQAEQNVEEIQALTEQLRLLESTSR